MALSRPVGPPAMQIDTAGQYQPLAVTRQAGYTAGMQDFTDRITIEAGIRAAAVDLINERRDLR